MAKIIRPHWQILITAAEQGTKVPLNCDECFLLLEHFAELAMLGTDERLLLQAVLDHLDRCPSCREHHLESIRELEALWHGHGP